MKDYLKYLEDINIEDEQISSSHYLYPLTIKYNVKINKSGKSDTYYVFRKRNGGFRFRIGHPMTQEQKEKHIRNFNIDYWEKPTYQNVEKRIMENLNNF